VVQRGKKMDESLAKGRQLQEIFYPSWANFLLVNWGASRPVAVEGLSGRKAKKKRKKRVVV